MKIQINDIRSIKVHWSESSLINDRLGCDDHSDIEKEVDIAEFDKLIGEAAKLVDGGYDKTSLTVVLNDGTVWARESKFYLKKSRDTLAKLLND